MRSSYTAVFKPWARVLRAFFTAAIGRLILLCLGAAFGGLTGRVLLWEVHSLADLTIEHYQTIGALAASVASGVFFTPMLRQRQVGVVLGLGIAFLISTPYCLIGSAGRSDELAFEKNAAARQINRDRDRAERNWREAKLRYDVALEAETAECNSGTGRKCISKRETTVERRSEFEVAELLLQQAKPEQRENGKLKRFAQVIALFSRASEEGAERGLVILWPYLPPLTYELLTIVFTHLGFAFGHKAKDKPDTSNPPFSSIQFKRRTHKTERNRGTSIAKTMARIDLIGYVEAHGAVPNQDFLVERWRRSKGTVSYWLAAWEREGLIHRHRDGKFKVTHVASVKLN